MGSLTDQLAVLEQQARAEVCGVADLERLHEVKVKFLGRKGLLTAVLQQLGAISAAERPVVGKRANEIKVFLETELKHREDNLVASIVDRKRTSLLDVTLPGRSEPPGHIHPVTQILEEIKSIFWGLGFSIHEGPEVETDYYNFEALNIPQEHPARDMQDTFYIGTGDQGPLLLRTHTSPVQIRVMEKQRPPIRIIAPGAVFRRDADVTHSPMFHQVEGLYVDRKVSMADLKGVLTIFVRALFGDSCPVRFRPSFFPFTEPSAEVDIGCVICGKELRNAECGMWSEKSAIRNRQSAIACRVCKGTGWLEILGSGMVHPAVFEHVGYDPKKVSGFAFGLGVERVAMLKFGIDDIRLLYSGDLRFLEQF